jgi:hypothetical protein
VLLAGRVVDVVVLLVGEVGAVVPLGREAVGTASPVRAADALAPSGREAGEVAVLPREVDVVVLFACEAVVDRIVEAEVVFAVVLADAPWLGDGTAVFVPADAVRRGVTGFASWLPVVAVSDFERAVVRLLVGVDFACSFASGDSDIFLMKMTPFYLLIRHEMAAEISLHSHEKRTVAFPLKGKETDPRWCSARHIFVCAHRRSCYG